MKAKEVHGDKYDYSLVDYKNNNTKVIIICPEHGKFEQTPKQHLRPNCCPKCAGRIKRTTEEFITKANKKHDGKYDYSKVKYINSKTKICIICPEHGEFWQEPSSHLSGCGCPNCGGTKKMTTEKFIAKAKKVHGDKYNYSKVEYKDNKTKVCIICPEHGEFWQQPSHHYLKGCGCPNCGGTKKMTTEKFIAKAKKVHGDKYDYSKVKLDGVNNEVAIICPEHGEFYQIPTVHLKEHGCPICNRGFSKQYKFNLLQEFKDEYAFRTFLANNDINILRVILRNVEPKFEPLKRDIERALANADGTDPIQLLEQKYGSESEDENEDDGIVETTMNTTAINTIDWDDDGVVNAVLATESKTDTGNGDELTIEEVVRNNEQELRVINHIEHMLTPEDREYIMEKFLNDKRRFWMAERENKLNK